MKIHNQTPSLECIFYIVNGMIEKIDLVEHHHSGCEWTIHFMDGEWVEQLEKAIDTWMEDYLSGKTSKIQLPLNLSQTTPFQKKVYAQLAKVPFGSYVSYQELGQLIGNEKGARAIGGACGKNPFPLVIPCHRVLAKVGVLGGFSCGIEIKKALLAFENITYDT